MASSSAFVTLPLPKPFLSKSSAFSSSNLRPTVLQRSSLKINAIGKPLEPAKVVPQGDRVLICLQDLPDKTAGGVLLPKSAVKFERYLMGEILSVGAEVGEAEVGKKVGVELHQKRLISEAVQKLPYSLCNQFVKPNNIIV